MIKVYNVGSIEYSKLMVFCRIANEEFLQNKKGFYVDVQTVYFDYSQDWKYSALITEDFNRDSSWQSVSPRDYENILKCDSFQQIAEWAREYARQIMEGKIDIRLTY